MKKIAFVVILFLCLGLCACSAGEKHFLAEDQWKAIYDDSVLVFNNDGTGEVNNYDSTWVADETTVTVTYTTASRTMDLTYCIVDLDGVTALIETANDIVGKKLYIQADGFETTAKKVEQSMQAQAEVLDWDDFHSEYLKNVARAAENYNEKIVEFTAKVYDINDNYCWMALKSSGSYPVDPVTVFLNSDDMKTINKFDEITVIGIFETDDNSYDIGSAFLKK